MAPGKLIRGIYAPTPTFFNQDESQSLDIAAHEEHILWLAKAGVQGVVIQGSTGEAVALTVEEKIQITKATRAILDTNGFEHVLVIAGAGAQSVLEAVSLARDAHSAGADHILVLPPSYFASSLNADSVVQYYSLVADKSPLPVIIYSWPGASGGLEITSDVFAILAKHPNIVGVKQTDHMVGKMARNIWLTKSEEFLVLAGGTDYLIGALAVGVHGAITGMANLTPRLLLKLVELYDKGKTAEAIELQGQISVAEYAVLTGGIPGFKLATQLFLGRGGVPRLPIPPASNSVLDKITKEASPVFQLEQKLWEEATL